MHYLLSFIFLAVSINGFAQTDLTTPDPITALIQKENTGKILFVSERKPLADLKESDFLKEVKLDKSTNLFIQTFLPNSLTNAMHVLAPFLTAEELDQVGNFQFTFFVDNILVYKEDLNRGAFGLERKNTATAFSVPLVTQKAIDSWGRFLWARFIHNGGEEAIDGGEHLLRIEIRPYISNPEKKTGELMASGQLIIRTEVKKIDETETLPSPIATDGDWKITEGIGDVSKIKELKAAILRNSLKEITSIVVIKYGNLVLEEYFNGASRKTLHDTRSVGKTFTSALTGMAIADGYIKSIDQSLGEFYPLKQYEHYTAVKEKVTIKNLLTMSSGFDGFDFDSSSPGNEENMYPQKDWVKWTLNLPMANRNPGEQWAYFTAGVVVLGDILNKNIPGGLEKYADSKLFKPLGITSYKWEFTPQKVVNTAGGLRLTSRELARFGQLYLDKGNYKGRQILPANWVEESLSQQLPIPEQGMNYGFLFWNKTYTVAGNSYEAYSCSGNGGNKVHIFKDLNMIIVITARAYNTPYMHQQADRITERYLLPAFIKSK